MAFPSAAQGSLHALRQVIARIDGSADRLPAGAGVHASAAAGAACRRLPLGIAPFDAGMGGGFPLAALTEIRTGETRDWGTACAFALMILARLQHQVPNLRRPLVWIAPPDARREGGELWLPGTLALMPWLPDLLLIRPRTPLEALWAAETGAASRGIGAILLEIRGNPACLGLTESRRLHFRARATGRPLLLLRQAGEAEATAAPARFLVEPAPAGLCELSPGVPLADSLGHAGLTVTLEKSRLPAPLSLILEWNPDDCRFDIRANASDSGRPAGEADSRALVSGAFDRPHHPSAAGGLLAHESGFRRRA